MKIDTGFWAHWEVRLTDRDGNPLPEHAVHHLPPRGSHAGRISFCVECVEGQEFSIVVDRPASVAQDVNVALRIDGRASSGIAYRRMSPHSVRKDTSYEEVGGVVRGRRLTFVTTREETGSIREEHRINDSDVSEDVTLSEAEDSEQDSDSDMEEDDERGTIVVTLVSGIFVFSSTGYPVVSAPPRPRSQEGEAYVGGDLGGPAAQSRKYSLTRDPIAPECQVRITYATRDELIARGIISPSIPVERRRSLRQRLGPLTQAFHQFNPVRSNPLNTLKRTRTNPDIETVSRMRKRSKGNLHALAQAQEDGSVPSERA